MLSDKNDSANGDGTIEFTTAPVNGDLSGTWEIDGLFGYSDIFITFKSAPAFGAFLLGIYDATPLSGTWASPNNALSHASIYYRPDSYDDDNPSGPGGPVVPLPAAGWMMIAALGGLAAAKRKRG